MPELFDEEELTEQLDDDIMQAFYQVGLKAADRWIKEHAAEICAEYGYPPDFLEPHQFEKITAWQHLFDENYLRFRVDYIKRREQFAKGYAKGLAGRDWKNSIVVKLLESGELTKEQIASVTELPLVIIDKLDKLFVHIEPEAI